MSTPPNDRRRRNALEGDLLVLRAMRGDRGALSELVDRWHPALVRHARGMGCDPERARDIAQDVWVAASSGLKKLREPERFRGWLFGVATRRVIDGLRRRGTERLDRDADVDGLAADATGESERDHATALLRRATARLDPEQRALISLRYVAELDSNEIGAALDIPAATARTRLAAARRALREHFDRLAAEEERRHE